MIETTFVLLVIYQLKHFFADFPLQNEYMQGKGKAGWDFIPPLLAHVLVHAIFTFMIVLSFTRELGFALVLSTFDLTIHFVMDRIKAGPKYLGRFENLAKNQFASATESELRSNKNSSTALGFDQMVHHLTHFVIIYLVITH